MVQEIDGKLTKTEPLESEGQLLLDHDYDGIKELDNNLPPWWVYLFYASIVF
jgi:cytochrome c oxidase cbb3-type subunit 3